MTGGIRADPDSGIFFEPAAGSKHSGCASPALEEGIGCLPKWPSSHDAKGEDIVTEARPSRTFQTEIILLA